MAMIVIGDDEDTHAIATASGRYFCTGCDYETMNRWGAEAHYEEHEGAIESSKSDKPDWL